MSFSDGDDMRRFFDRFSLYELVLLAVMAAIGVAIKPIVSTLAHIVCGPLMIPGGAVAGGLYMMWIIIGYGLVKKPGSALLIALIQALLVLFTGIIGSHGIMSLLTYSAPGIAVELVMLITGHRGCCRGCSIIGCIMANMAGTACVNYVFFKTPGMYLIMVLAIAALSGMVGGIIGWQLVRIFDNANNRVKNRKRGRNSWVED